MAFPTGWSDKLEIKSDNTKVSGSSNHTDFPSLILDGNLPANSFVWFETTAQSGTVDSLNLSVIYDKD